MRRSDWYFRGYERVEEPEKKGKRTAVRLVYTGGWYGFPGGKRQSRSVKLRCGSLFALVVAAYLYAQLNPVLGGRVRWLAATSMLAFIPLMFEAVAFISFIPAGERWEYRVYYSGYRRLFRFGCVLAGVLIIWLLMELWFIIRFPEWLAAESFYLLAILACVAAQILMLIILRKNPVRVLENTQRQENLGGSGQ